MLEVVDADKKQPGVQIEPGKFIDSNQSFILQHQVNNIAGTIDYALTLVNPAPPVKGNGALAKITFRAKAEGQTTLSITEGLFGARTGETIAPALDSTELQIVAQKGNDVQLVSEGETAASIEEQTGDASGSPAGPLIPSFGSVRALAGLAGTGLAGTGLVSGWLRLRHARHG